MTPQDLIAEREKTHGSFADNARVSQAIKDTLRTGARWQSLSTKEREAADMIAAKLARLVNGAGTPDNMADIAGYATLAGEGSGRCDTSIKDIADWICTGSPAGQFANTDPVNTSSPSSTAKG